MTDSQKLLAEYVQGASEAAFRELVARYVNSVYSAAIRLMDKEKHLAEDVVQTVFLDLALQAHKLPPKVMLGGWLHRHTCFVAATLRRREHRRRSRERQAMEINAQRDHSEIDFAQIASLLDEAINQLAAADRTAILLRFFEQCDFRSIGEALGVNEEAARKRVGRALEKLHSRLARRGIASSAGALAASLSSGIVKAAPAGLAAGISGNALAAAATATAAGPGTALTFFKFLTMTKLKLGLIGAVVTVSLATPWIIQLQTQTRLREANRLTQRQAAQLANLALDNKRLSELAAQNNDSKSLAGAQLNELLRLRGEVTRLRNQELEEKAPKQSQARLESPNSQNAQPPAPMIYPDSVAKDSYAFSGYTTPEEGVQSMLWAMTRGDPKTLFASYAPNMQQVMADVFKDMPDGVLPGGFSNGDLYNASGFHVVNQEDISNDETALKLFLEGRHTTVTLVMQNIGGNWKLARIE